MSTHAHGWSMIVAILAITLAMTWTLTADEGDAPASDNGNATATQDQTQPGEQPAPPANAPSADAPSADDVMQDLLDAGRPTIDPSTRPGGDTEHGATAGAAPTLDPAVVGVAPGAAKPKLRPEGEFVPLRRGRVVRTPDGTRSLFVFEADSRTAPEPPMILIPCQLLETMEDMIAERGDKLVFIVSGEITTYRGANYLLPSLMRLAVDSENLR